MKNLNAVLTQILKEGMLTKDQQLIDTIRMLKTKIMEKKTSVGFVGDITDEVIEGVIAAYKKSLQKVIPEFEAVGERGKVQVKQLQYEIGICDKFLPKQLTDNEIRVLISEKFSMLNVVENKHIGKVVGDIIKANKGLVDGVRIKKLAEEMLISYNETSSCTTFS